MKIVEAIDVLTKELIGDPDYRRSWHANIAMAFKDSYTWNEDKLDINKIANDAADYFLWLLCMPSTPPASEPRHESTRSIEASDFIPRSPWTADSGGVRHSGGLSDRDEEHE